MKTLAMKMISLGFLVENMMKTMKMVSLGFLTGSKIMRLKVRTAHETKDSH